jgi:hypothetical protein
MLPSQASTADASLLLPTGFDLLWWLIASAVALTIVAALGRVVTSLELSPTARLVWIVLILLAPPIGPIAALGIVKSRRSTRQARTSPRS